MIEKRQFYINGSWVDPIERDHHVINPSTEEAVAVISLGVRQIRTQLLLRPRLPFLLGWQLRPAKESRLLKNSIRSTNHAQRISHRP